MRKWNMTMVYSTAVEFGVEAETYDEAVKKAYEQATDFLPDVKDLEYGLEDYEELPDDYEELANGYSDELEEEEFEPGRTYVDVMGLNP